MLAFVVLGLSVVVVGIGLIVLTGGNAAASRALHERSAV
jgi:hypothetical protein